MPPRVTVPASPEVVLIRHGESEWSRLGRYAGRVDVQLTPNGRREMEAVGRVLGARSFGRVLSSPLERARDSCRLAGLEAAVEVRPELVEWDYGTNEGRTGADVAAERPGWSLWIDGAPGGESVDDVGARIDPIVEELRVGGDAAVFAHRDVLRVFAARWLGLPPESGRFFLLDTASISVLGHEGESFCIRSWNETGHVSEPSG